MRSQMNPHFIFNALNSVNSFIAVNDERNANRYLSEFSVLMRSVLENSDEDFIPFSKEIELIELYVKLEHNRFQEKFDYSITIDEAIDLDEYKFSIGRKSYRFNSAKQNLTLYSRYGDYKTTCSEIDSWDLPKGLME